MKRKFEEIRLNRMKRDLTKTTVPSYYSPDMLVYKDAAEEQIELLARFILTNDAHSKRRILFQLVPATMDEYGLYNKCCGDTNCIFAAFIFFPKRGENMIKPTEFVNYVDRLPDDCVESMTDGEVHFHLPHPGHLICPFCSSSHIGVHQYRPQVLRGIPGATKRYVYNRRRYRCHDCGKTFVEESPFLASFQRRIGNRLRQIRARKKLSQREVIESIGIPFHLYVKYEDDVEPEIPSTLVAMKIAECLGTDVLDIWGDQLK